MKNSSTNLQLASVVGETRPLHASQVRCPMHQKATEKRKKCNEC